MSKTSLFRSSLAAAVLVPVLACNSTSVSATAVSVTLTPTSATLQVDATAQFAATVAGSSDPLVTWSVAEGAAGGAVSTTGLYTAPGIAGSYHVVATSVADPTKSASAAVTVTAGPVQVTSVSVSPGSAALIPGGTQAFTALVDGAASTAVTWSVASGGAGGTIDSSGLYTAPAHSGADRVIATSTATPSVSGSAAVAITSTPAPILEYLPATLACTLEVPCSLAPASISGGASFSYSVSPALPAGLAIAAQTGIVSGTPTALSPAASYTITAASSAGSATATVTVSVVDAAPSLLSYPSQLVCFKNSACPTIAPTHAGGAVLSYAITPALSDNLRFDPTTGIVSGTPTAFAATASYTVTATNSGGSASTALSITVDDVPLASLTYSPASLICIIQTACGLPAPTVTGGAILTFSIAPTLPMGLNLDPASGAISGTPTEVAADTNYVITAVNSGGAALADVSITVNAVAPAQLTYSTSSLVCIRGLPCTLAAPTSTGGAVSGYSIAPPLPLGLSLDPMKGGISGTPSVLSTPINYTVTAFNSGGSTSAALSLAIQPRATQLVFSQQPTDAPSGSLIAPAVIVSLTDAQGHVDTLNNSQITLSVTSNAATLDGTSTVSAINGVATFSDLSITQAGVYTLTAGSVGLPSSASEAFSISAGSAAQLAFVQEPTAALSGQPFTPVVSVAVEDAAGNVVTTFDDFVTLSISGAILANNSQPASAGIATFTSLAVSGQVGSYALFALSGYLTPATSTSFSLGVGAATQLVFTGQPPLSAQSGLPFTQAVQVAVEDSGGNVVTSSGALVTLAIPAHIGIGSGGASTLTGNGPQGAASGIATFTPTLTGTVGGYVLIASSSGLSSATSRAVQLAAGNASQLAFTTEPPANAQSGQPMPGIAVSVQDSSGNLVPSSTALISLSPSAGGDATLGGAAGTLSGLTSQAASGGVATLDPALAALAGSYSLTASSNGLGSATSSFITISAGNAAQLAFVAQPGAANSGVPFTQPVQVAVEDSAGNVVTSSSAVIGLASNLGALAGGSPTPASSGVASFSATLTGTAGSNYSLTATSSGFASVASSTFALGAGVPAKLAFIQQPPATGSLTNIPITPAIQVGEYDQSGNLCTNAGDTITLALAPASSITLNGASVAASSSVATFSQLSFAQPCASCTLSATSGSLSAAYSTQFTVAQYPIPTLSGITPPAVAGVGTQVTLTGTNLSTASAVTFNGAAQPVFTASADGTQITLLVPSGATSGPVAVTTPGGTATLPGYIIASPPASAPTVSNSIFGAATLTVTFSAVAAATGYTLAWVDPTGVAAGGSCSVPAPPTIRCTGIPAGTWDFSLYATSLGGSGPAQAIGSVPQAICGPSPSIPGYLAIADSINGSSDQVVTNTGAAYLTLPGQPVGTSNILFDGAGNMLVASGAAGDVTYYPIGCAVPSTVIYTGGFGSHGIAINGAGELAVGGVDNLVRVFPPGATSPSRTLSGGTSINAVIWDSSDNLYVAATNGGASRGALYEYAPGATTPTYTSTTIDQPYTLAYDPTTNTVVTNDYKSGNLLFFTFGQTSPSRTLNFDGSYVDPIFTFDSLGNLAVADQTHLKIYASGSSTASFTANVYYPQALAFDSSDDLALTDGATVQVFAPGATTPTYTVSGFGNPIDVAFVPNACNPALGVCEAAINCGAILANNPAAQSGVYWIQPAGTETPQQVYCDMSSDGGGWTLVANEVVGDDPGYVTWSSTSGYRTHTTNYLTQTWRASDSDLNAIRNQGVYRLTGNVAFGHRFAKSSCIWSSATLNTDCNATYSDLNWDGEQMEGPVGAIGEGGQNGTCYDLGGITDYYEPNCNLGNALSYSFLRTSNEGTGGQGFDIWVPCGDTACGAASGTANQVWVR